MNQLYQYDPYTGGQSLPSYGPQYQNDGLLNALFRDLTRQQILGAFTPQEKGSAFLDMLMNGLPSSAPSSSAQPSAVAAPPAEVIQNAVEQDMYRNDGEVSSGFTRGGIDAPAAAIAAGAAKGATQAAYGAMQEATSTHGGSQYSGARDSSNGGGPGGKGG